MNPHQLAQQTLIESSGLSEQDLQNVLAKTLDNHAVSFADLYFQHQIHESWSLEDGKVKEGSLNIEQGVGVRAISGEKTGFAYSDDISLSALEEAASSARAIARIGQSGTQAADFSPSENTQLYIAKNPLKSIQDAEKIALLQYADKAARDVDPRVEQVFVSISGVYESILNAATDGTYIGDIRPLVRFNVSVIVEDNGKREQGGSGGGGRFGYEFFTHEKVTEYAQEAVRQALVLLDAVPAPAGALPVVLGPGWPGVLLHEAVGHGLEGDFNRKGTSAFSGKIGQKVASEHCTVVDDGTLADRRGSLSVDDEGVQTQNTVLIENGILKGYMQDKHNAQLMGHAVTGNGRRESYAHLPMPRMTNTYMLAGQYPPEELIQSVEKGLYAVNFGGGQVDITSGQFVFSASEAYLIENGKVTQPVKGATLIGNGPEAMNDVSMVGNDLALDAGVGTCGKDGQSVPVGVGQPSLKIDNMTIGGTGV